MVRLIALLALLMGGTLVGETFIFIVYLRKPEKGNNIRRIQIYDNNLAFLKGWHIEGSGGPFTASVSDNNFIFDIF